MFRCRRDLWCGLVFGLAFGETCVVGVDATFCASTGATAIDAAVASVTTVADNLNCAYMLNPLQMLNRILPAITSRVYVGGA